MNIRKWVAHVFIYLLARVATRRPIPEAFSLSSSAKPLHNFCYFALVYPKSEKTEKFLIKSIIPKLGYNGISFPMNAESRFVDSMQGIETCLPYSILGFPHFEILRIYGSQQIVYSNAWEFLAGEFTLLPLRWHRREVRRQHVFERSFRFTCERISTLSAIIDWRREAPKRGTPRQFLRNEFSQFDLYTQLFSYRAWELKDRDQHLAELELVLDSLVSSSDLGHNNNGYFIAGKALQTLSDFETDDRRAKAADRANTRMFWLTVIITLATGIQAYGAWESLASKGDITQYQTGNP